MNTPIDIASWMANPCALPKLVRDQIPAILTESRVKFKYELASDEAAYRAFLTRKLVEEAFEAKSALIVPQLVQELADIFEVIDAILQEYGIDRDEVLRVQEGKRAGRGGFESRIVLVECE